MRPVWYLDSLWFMPPYNPPQTQHFAQKITPENCAKKFPQFPRRGGMGERFSAY